MCGLTGYFSFKNNFDPKAFANANNLVKHRGPDDFGYVCIDRDFRYFEFFDENLSDYKITNNFFIGGLGFRRLSIIDLSKNGHQPFVDEINKIIIIFNGEIYNYTELRTELEKSGHKFKSNTDTEVIIKGYIEWGAECVKKFNGMWAFCLVDIKSKKLFCSRDRLGIKPFYYFQNNEYFIFASEVKQILPLLPVSKEVNGNVMLDYLYGSYGNETEECFFKSILKLQAGHNAFVSFNNKINVTINKYWDLPPDNDYSDNFYNENLSKETLLNLFENSIRLRLRSDVPVGTCLSGGLDSSGIVCFVKNVIGDSSHKLFHIQSIDEKYNEKAYVDMIVKKTGFDIFIKKPENIDFICDYRKFVWHHDEPLIKASMFGGYEVYRHAKENGVTVVLDGQGADELLGGYYNGVHLTFLYDLLLNYRWGYFGNQLKRNSLTFGESKRAIIQKLLTKIIKSFFKNNFKIIYSGILKNNILKYLQPYIYQDFISNNIIETNILNPGYEPIRDFGSRFKKESYILTKHTNLPGILRQVDRNSMASSVEARVPFLDYRLVEFFFKLPTISIMKDGFTKYIYREAMKNIIPEEIRLRTDKIGFEMPERLWLMNSKGNISEFLNSYSDDNIFNVKMIRKDFLRSIENPDKYNSLYWRIINAMFWKDIFFKNYN